MKYINKFDSNLSQIGLGTGRFGTKVSIEDSYIMLDLFEKYGGNVIDTARNYYEWVENGRGKSEETIGNWMELKKNRNKIYISTKGGVKNNGKIFTANLDRSNLCEELKESLEALKTDYIDLYLLHRDEPERCVEEIMETLQEINEYAKVKVLGVCNWSSERVKQANAYAIQHNLKTLQMIQTWWSIAAYTPKMWDDPTTTHMDLEMYQYLLENNMVGMAYTSQAKGFFQKAIMEGYDNVDSFLKSRIATNENLRRLNHIKEYCHQKNISATAVVNGYITDNILPGIALVSCSSLPQLEDILTNCDTIIEKEWIEKIPLCQD